MVKTKELAIGIPHEIASEIDILLKTEKIKIFNITSRRQFVISSIKKYIDYVNDPTEYLKKENSKDIKRLQVELEDVIAKQKKEYKIELKNQNLVLESIKKDNIKAKENYNKLAKTYRELALNHEVTDENINKKIDELLKEKRIAKLD